MLTSAIAGNQCNTHSAPDEIRDTSIRGIKKNIDYTAKDRMQMYRTKRKTKEINISNTSTSTIDSRVV